MRRTWIKFFALLFAVLVVIGGLFGAAQGYLNSRDFRARLIEEVSRKLGCDLRVGKMKIRLHRGLDWVDIRASRQDLHPPDFMKAERLRLRYDLFQALFRGKVVLTDVRLSKPDITLDLSVPIPEPLRGVEVEVTPPSGTAEPATGTPPVGSDIATRKPSAEGGQAVPGRAPSRPSEKVAVVSVEPWPAPPRMDLKSLVVEDGACELKLTPSDRIVCGGLQVRASFSNDPVPTGTGNIGAATLQLPRNLLLRSMRGQFLWREETITVPSLTAQLCGGNAEATLRLERPKEAPIFDATVVLKDLSISEIARVAGVPDLPLVGKLQAQVRLQGTLAAVGTPNGLGQIKVRDGRFVRAPGLAQLAGLLNRPEFYDLPLTACEADFTLQANRLELSRIMVSSAEIDLTGTGWLNFEGRTQELQLKLGIAPALAATLPPGLFEGLPRRTTGWVEIPFKIWGSLDHPQNDLVARFAALQMRAIGGTIFDRIFQSMPQSK